MNLNTYSVSQNTVIKGGVAKLRYNLSNNTNFTATVYSSGQQADSTGNGDNDNIPYDTRLAQIQANAPNCALPTDRGGAKSGYTVIIDAAGDTACSTAANWAAASSGPYGGGADRNRGTNMSDYHFRLQTTSGIHTITADGFYNYYKYYKSSEQAGAAWTDRHDVCGDRVLAVRQFAGLARDRRDGDQRQGRGRIRVLRRIPGRLAAQLQRARPGPLQLHAARVRALQQRVRARTVHVHPGPFSAFGAFWIKNSSVDNQTSFDPRVSLVFRPAPADIVRLTYGHSTGDPAAELKANGPPVLNGNPSSLNPSCTPYNVIGSAETEYRGPSKATTTKSGTRTSSRATRRCK